MFHHEFIVENYTVWVKSAVSKLEAFASICRVPTDQSMGSAFVMNFLRATPLDCKGLDKLPRPASGRIRVVRRRMGPFPDTYAIQAPSAMLLHPTSGMSMLCQQQSYKPWTASKQGQAGIWWHLGNGKTFIFLH